MQGLVLVVLAGCVAAAAGLTFKSGGVQRELFMEARRNKEVGLGKLRQNQDGIDTRFNGPSPTGGRLTYKVKRDFAVINPRTETADWRWALPVEVDADHGAFLRDAPNTVDLVSLPLTSWYSPDETLLGPLTSQYEAIIVNKQNISVMPGQELNVNVKFACKTFNLEDFPLSHEASVKPEDDPSLANCGFGIASYDESALIFSIVATSRGVWSVYERNRFELYAHPERRQKEFTIFQKLVDRSSPYDAIDATIRYVRAEGKVEFIVDGEVKHTITKIGTIDSILDSEEGKDYKDVYTRTRPDFKETEPQDFQVVIGISNYPDATDPNNPSNPPLRGVRLTTNPNFYDAKAIFEDTEGKKENAHFGEGAAMTLMDINIELTGTGRMTGRDTGRFGGRRTRL